MTQPHRRPVPREVSDVLLWLLATDVATAHLSDPHGPGRCANLRCTGQPYPCPPARDAHRAFQAAIRSWQLAGGRTRVAAARFAGWFRPTPAGAPAQRPLPSPRAA